jgi:hypothetical protein
MSNNSSSTSTSTRTSTRPGIGRIVGTVSAVALTLGMAASVHVQGQPQNQPQEQQAQNPFQQQAQGRASQQAQNNPRTLSLFEAVEQSSAGNDSQASGPRNPSVSASNGPQFALVGTSRFGDRYRVSVRASGGDVITVDAGDGGSAAIPGYPGFRVTQVASRHVILEHPASTPCFEFRDQGVTCDGSNVARLALATAEPVAPPQEPASRRDRRAQGQDGQGSGDSEQSAEDRPQNPFAAALRAARERDGEPDAAASRAEEQRFRPRRIDPDDVPEGYRLVRTPFGDRVVPL